MGYLPAWTLVLTPCFFLSLSWVLSFNEVWQVSSLNVLKLFSFRYMIYSLYKLLLTFCGFGKIVFEHNKTRRN
jgi:hypothetical protein